MNWYKTCQQIDKMWTEVLGNEHGVEIVGSGQNETLVIPGASSAIVARDLLNKVKTRIEPILKSKHINKIDTSPIGQTNAQGLAKSDTPGVIYIDVKKIFNAARNALSPTAQTDGTQVDPDVAKSIIQRMSEWIEAELTETGAHESQHMGDFGQAIIEGKPFTSVQESSGEQFGKKTRKQFFSDNVEM